MFWYNSGDTGPSRVYPSGVNAWLTGVLNPYSVEEHLGRVINPETAGKERTQLVRAVVLALRELMQQQQPDMTTKDLAAFLALALESIYATIDTSVAAWEKRDYWVKADRFRMEWNWSDRLGKTMRQAVQQEDWAGVAKTAAEIGMRVNHVKVPQRHKLGTPWVGAYQKMMQS